MPERPPRRPPTEDPEANLPFAERWIAPFFREPMLWPVGIVLIAHAVAFLAPVLLFSVRDRKLAALAALALLLVLTGSLARAELGRQGRPGIVCGLLTAIWALAAATALLAHRTGIF